jgi:hypothetical protein
MPNWCNNFIEIQGDKKTITKLSRIIKDSNNPDDNSRGVFAALIGTKPFVTAEDYDKGAWYDANSSWFGTKWDISYDEYNFTFNDESISIQCETAWSPPIPFLATLCNMYGVSGVITYDEGGCDFAGRTTIDNEGNIVEEEDYTYNEGLYVLDNESFWSNLESNIEYYAGDNTPVEEFVSQYDFVSDEDKEEIKKLYEEYLVDNDITIETENA